jgi:hypothetical protein
VLTIDQLAEIMAHGLKTVCPPGTIDTLTARVTALEQQLAAVDGIPAPPGTASEKPRIKYAGLWTRQMFAPGAGVTHLGKVYQCLQPTWGEPSQDTTSWQEVA